MSLKNLIKAIGKKEVLSPVLANFLNGRQVAIAAGEVSKKKGVILDAKLTVECYTARIEEFNHGEEIKGEFFHPSALGGCMRREWFKHYKAPRDVTPSRDFLQQEITFEIGTHVHVIIQNLCARAGVLVKREVAIQNTKEKVLGHADAIIRIDGTKYLLEIKTINSRGFTMLANDCHHGHKRQIMTYMKCLGLQWGIVFYVDKDRSQTKEFVIQFDEDFYNAECGNRIKGFFKNVRDCTMPPRDGTSTSDFVCRYCEFQQLCWTDTERLKYERQLKQQHAKKVLR